MWLCWTQLTMADRYEAVQLVRRLLTDPRLTSVDAVVDTLCKEAAITQKQLAGPSREQPLPSLRYAASYLLRKRSMITLESIGEIIQRDHSTVMYGISEIERSLAENRPALPDKSFLP